MPRWPLAPLTALALDRPRPTTAPKPGAPKSEAPKSDPPTTAATKSTSSESGSPKSGAPRSGAPRSSAPKSDSPKPDAPKTTATTTGKADAPKSDPPKAETPKASATTAKAHPPKPGPAKAVAKVDAPTAAPQPPTAPYIPPQPSPPVTAGRYWAFDTCETPSLDAMAIWKRASPYNAVGIYIGGPMRGCPNPTLDNPDWVHAVVAMGWKLLPVYIGPQAPCTDFHVRLSYDLSVATDQGIQAADDAINHALTAGLQPGAPIYADVEHYFGDTPCNHVVRAYLSGWTRRLHDRGFVAGLYGNFNSAVTAEAAHAAEFKPVVDAIWVAWWTGNGGMTGFPGVPDSAWAYDQRVHQYLANYTETWGGVTMLIDINAVDGPVAP